jgi:hypothetical protein
MLGDAVDVGPISEIDRQTSGTLENCGIKLKPAWAASFRKPTVGNDNIRRRTSSGEVGPVDPVG